MLLRMRMKINVIFFIKVITRNFVSRKKLITFLCKQTRGRGVSPDYKISISGICSGI